MNANKIFFDTNTLLYLLSTDNHKANWISKNLQQSNVISIQVLNEFTSASLRKIKLTRAELDEILDLFTDEDIKLSDNVTGLFDLGIIPADFTRQITLPGTKKNNAFFEHVYDISVFNPDTFATNIKVPAYLDFGGLYLSQGYLQLNKVNLYANKFIDTFIQL